ncbi:hypothetical protein HNR62_000311 [Oceanisphaera litoralis]|uniref:hypothetical protein n=1 Tax=Oceanisphaera litoralis TaxID=225144 RepID=UPI00195DEC7E|nr:hypothetical protein [Oceanisphaera litoralis]MBM7454482.1 hypothetical protein [Oceanisphaera litoralis]
MKHSAGELLAIELFTDPRPWELVNIAEYGGVASGWLTPDMDFVFNINDGKTRTVDAFTFLMMRLPHSTYGPRCPFCGVAVWRGADECEPPADYCHHDHDQDKADVLNDWVAMTQELMTKAE